MRHVTHSRHDANPDGAASNAPTGNASKFADMSCEVPYSIDTRTIDVLARSLDKLHLCIQLYPARYQIRVWLVSRGLAIKYLFVLRQHMLTHSFDIQTTLHILDVTAKTAEDESVAGQTDRRVV